MPKVAGEEPHRSTTPNEETKRDKLTSTKFNKDHHDTSITKTLDYQLLMVVMDG